MKRKLQIVLALFIAMTIVSCVKDNLYIVEGEGGDENNQEEGGDSSDENVDEQIINKITSLIIVSDDYSEGIPAIQTTAKYTYTAENYNGEISTFTSGSRAAISQIKVKVNPSNASLDSIEWKVVRRRATTKIMDDEDVFTGEISASRSESAPELVTLSIENNVDGFYDIDGGYVYSVVAVQNDGAQVSSDVACLVEGADVAISDVFMGLKIDGKVVDYSDNFTLLADSMILDKPEMYGILPSGDVLSFGEMYIDESQYSLNVVDFAGLTLGKLEIDILECDEKEPINTSSKWKISLSDEFEEYHYNEINGYVGINFAFNDSEGAVVELLYCRITAYMDDVELTSKASVSSNFTSLTFGVFSSALAENLFMERLVDTSTGNGVYSFTESYCDVDWEANATKFYMDGEVSTDMTLDYVTNPDNIQLTVHKQLPVGVYEIKVVLSSRIYTTVLTEIVTLTVE